MEGTTKRERARKDGRKQGTIKHKTNKKRRKGTNGGSNKHGRKDGEKEETKEEKDLGLEPKWLERRNIQYKTCVPGWRYMNTDTTNRCTKQKVPQRTLSKKALGKKGT